MKVELHQWRGISGGTQAVALLYWRSITYGTLRLSLYVYALQCSEHVIGTC